MGVLIERQLPERGDRGVSAAPAGNCCCCCCCCLHSVGSIAGALSARPERVEPDQIPPAAIDRSTAVPKHSATGLYWALCAIASGILITYAFGADANARPGEVAVVLALVLPALQFGASLAAWILLLMSRRPGKELRLRHLGRITLRSFLGAVIGVVIMVVILPMLKC